MSPTLRRKSDPRLATGSSGPMRARLSDARIDIGVGIQPWSCSEEDLSARLAEDGDRDAQPGALDQPVLRGLAYAEVGAARVPARW
jgi:hypothetical protein